MPAERLRLLTETAHFVDELTNTVPDPDQPYVGRNAFAHKGGMHVAGVQADARTFEHLDPKLVGNSRDVLISELSGRGSVLSRAEGAGIDLDADAAKRAVERIKEREHRGYHYEAADASFELLLRREAGEYQSLFRLESFRVITEKRADGRVETEATIKIWVEGRRYVRTAEGNGPVNALDRALRDAIGELHPHLADIELVDYKVRILDSHHGTGAVTRVLLDSSDGHESWGSIGVSENIIEASWEALVDSLEYAFQPSRRAAAPLAGRTGDQDPGPARHLGAPPGPWRIALERARPDPARAARARRARVRARARGAAIGAPLARADARALRAAVRGADRRRARRRRLVGNGRASPRRSSGGLGLRRRGRHLAVQLRRLRELPALRGRRAGLLRRRSGDPEPRPGRGLGGDLRAHRRHPPGRHPGLPGRAPGVREASPPRATSACSRTRARRSAPSTPTASRSARGGTSATFAFYANKQLTTGEGGMLTTADADVATRLRSERNQGRAPNMSWVDHERLGFNYRLTEVQAALGMAQLERLDEMLAARGRAAQLYGERLAALDYGAPAGEGDPAGLLLPCADRDAERRSWFVYAVRLPSGADRDAVVADLAQRGVEAKAYMPSIHLMPHIRERFGYREGQFPVAEDASSRLLALPFFPAITESQIDRVCEATGRGAARQLDLSGPTVTAGRAGPRVDRPRPPATSARPGARRRR